MLEAITSILGNENLAWIKNQVTSAKLEAFNATSAGSQSEQADIGILKIKQDASPPVQQI
jgi:hypothetical protein